MFTLVSTTFARGDGGFGGPAVPAPSRTRSPSASPISSLAAETRMDQALLYRLNGDRNPLHADPELAKRVGFPVPILHGLCTYGTACRAVLQAVCKYDHRGSRGFDVRFSAPVYPGETISPTCGSTGTIVSFRCRAEGARRHRHQQRQVHARRVSRRATRSWATVRGQASSDA